jgi:DNA-binding IscR family transcriptional regulator
MPCMDSRGELTEMARKILAAMDSPAPLEQVAERTGIPLYRMRSATRELVDAGLVEEKEGSYVAAEAGRAALAKHAGQG